jgi:hypothetical protein
MKPIELVFLILSAAAGVIVLFMMITLIRKADREKREHDDATREKSEP